MCATAFLTSIVVHLPRPPYGKRTTASAKATVVTARQTRRRPIAASIARGMKTCRRRKPLDAGMIGRQGPIRRSIPRRSRPPRSSPAATWTTILTIPSATHRTTPGAAVAVAVAVEWCVHASTIHCAWLALALRDLLVCATIGRGGPMEGDCRARDCQQATYSGSKIFWVPSTPTPPRSTSGKLSRA
jgi:hypothetical protein